MNIPPSPLKNGSSKNSNIKQRSSSLIKKQPIVRKQTNTTKVKKPISERGYEPINTSYTSSTKKKTNSENTNSNKTEISKRQSKKFAKEQPKGMAENSSFYEADEKIKDTNNKFRAYDTENLDKYNSTKETKRSELAKDNRRTKESMDYDKHQNNEFKKRQTLGNQFHEIDTYNQNEIEEEEYDEQKETQEIKDRKKMEMSRQKKHTEEYETSEQEDEEMNEESEDEQRKMHTHYENSKEYEEEYYEGDEEYMEEDEEEYEEEEDEEGEDEEYIEEYEEEEQYEEEEEEDGDDEEEEEDHYNDNKYDEEQYRIEIKKDTNDIKTNEKKWYEKENDFLAKLHTKKQNSINSRSASPFKNNSKDIGVNELKDKKFIKSNNSLEKSSSNRYSIFKENAKKSYNIGLDAKRSFSMKLPSSNTGYNTPTQKKNRMNELQSNKIFKSKSQVLRAAELFLSVSNTPIPKLERKSTESSFIRKNKNLEKLSIVGPFKPKEKEKKMLIRKSGHLPSYMKHSIKRMSSNFRRENNRKKMKLIPQQKPNTFKIFQNLIILDNEGKIHMWDGYQWNHLYIPYESFTSLHTNKFGNVLCINKQYDCGYLLNSKHFRCIHSWEQYNFAKIVFSNKGKLWGISLTGDLFRWNKFEWKKIKKAYGIANLKSISFDRQNQLWALDICDYFYIFDNSDKSWVVKDIIGKNIRDFDFNKNNHMIATTNEGLIKIHNSEKWINYGMLGQKQIATIHFIRENNLHQEITKN